MDSPEEIAKGVVRRFEQDPSEVTKQPLEVLVAEALREHVKEWWLAGYAAARSQAAGLCAIVISDDDEADDMSDEILGMKPEPWRNG